MNRDDVVKTLLEIKALSIDPQAGHSEEYRLYLRVLKSIAEGNKDAKQLAKLAITASDIPFKRWKS